MVSYYSIFTNCQNQLLSNFSSYRKKRAPQVTNLSIPVQPPKLDGDSRQNLPTQLMDVGKSSSSAAFVMYYSTTAHLLLLINLITNIEHTKPSPKKELTRKNLENLKKLKEANDLIPTLCNFILSFYSLSLLQ